jgi:hypothetical protein
MIAQSILENNMLENTSLQHDISFHSIFVVDTAIYPVNFKVNIRYDVASFNSEEHTIAIRRILFFFNEVLNKSIFIAKDNPILSKMKKFKGPNIFVELPDVPSEHILGLLLYDKIQAIVQDVFVIDTFTILGDYGNISYVIDSETKFVDEGEDVWWERPDPSVSDDYKANVNQLTWDMLELTLDEELIEMPSIELIPGKSPTPEKINEELIKSIEQIDGEEDED